MKDRLIDTNILVYAYDTSEGNKHRAARELLKSVWEEGGGIVCLQNLMEFFVVITKKVENLISIVVDVEERRKRAIDIVGRFSSGKRDISRKHDTYLAEAFSK